MICKKNRRQPLVSAEVPDCLQDLSWEEIPTGGPGPPATGSHSAVLDACGTMWAFGGWTGDGSGDAPSHALLNFTTQAGAWVSATASVLLFGQVRPRV